MLGSNRTMHDAYRVPFRDRFAHCPDLPVHEFRSYLTKNLTNFLLVRLKRLAANSVMRLNRSAFADRPDVMVYLTKCTCLCLF